ncbi:MAG: tetratricopeptide repeat protein [Chloroflexota bacterium]|nr:tetratricopeptide repeat protein [Chloroflexota bacterium]
MSGAITFGQWLREQRKARDLTQEMLAARIGCSIGAIQKIEVGARRPSRQVAELLAEVFGIPAADLAEFVRFARSRGDVEQAEAEPVYAELVGGTQAAPAAEPTQTSQNGHTAQTVEANLPGDNLPAQLTQLIGRDVEAAEISSRLLREEVRLLTLTGAPGTGKTRLAIEVAANVKSHFEAVCFVALSAVSEPDLVLPTVAHAMGLKDAGEATALPQLAQYISARPVLLLLDNFEQVLRAAPRVTELLVLCPHLKVLVTSREALNVRGEQQFQVPPLALPDPERLPALEQVSHYPAIALFEERARAVRPDFELNAENAEAVALICERLDGLPLAIELAAARTRLFPPQQIAARLDSRLKLLTGGARDLPARQQTLRGAIDWSYNLLDRGEQTLLARMGVFVGGCGLSAVEAICNAEGDLPMEALDGLASLLDKSLVRQYEGPNGDTRFTMLETIREYAREQLEALGEHEVMQRMHAEFYLALAEAAEPQLIGAEQTLWLDSLESDHDNIRAVLRWAIEQGHADFAARLGATLWQFWFRRGYYSEGREWMQKALSMPQAGPTVNRANALNVAGFLAYGQGDFAAMACYYDEGLALARELGYKPGIAYALEGHGIVAHHKGDYEQAARHFNESLELAKEVGNGWGVSNALFRLGNVALNEGRYEEARNLHERSLAMRRSLGDTGRIASSLLHLGEVARCRQDYDEAFTRYSESLDLYRHIGVKDGIASSYHNLGHVYYRRGDYAQAAEVFRKGLLLFRELGDKLSIVECVTGLAAVAVGTGQAERAARLFGASEAALNAMGTTLDPADQMEYEHNVKLTRSKLPSQAFSEHWDRGHTMTLDQAIDYALSTEHVTIAG